MSKKDAKNVKKPKAEKEKPKPQQADKKGSALTKLDDLPSLGGFGKKQPAPKIEEDSNGFNDFDFDDDQIGDSSNKLSDAEKKLSEFYKDEKEGFKV